MARAFRWLFGLGVIGCAAALGCDPMYVAVDRYSTTAIAQHDASSPRTDRLSLVSDVASAEGLTDSEPSPELRKAGGRAWRISYSPNPSSSVKNAIWMEASTSGDVITLTRREERTGFQTDKMQHSRRALRQRLIAAGNTVVEK
jgi:hypothetical protein